MWFYGDYIGFIFSCGWLINMVPLHLGELGMKEALLHAWCIHRHHLPHPSEPHRAQPPWSKACRYICHWTRRRYTAVTKEPWSIAEELLPRSLSRREVAAIFIVKASFHPCSPPCLEDLTSWSAAISHCWSLAWPWSGEPQLHATGSPPLIASLVDSRQPDPCPPFSTMRPAHPDLLSYLHVWRNAWHQVAIFIILEFYLFYCFKDYYVIFVFYF